MTDIELKPQFGDLIENGWASEANPTRVGYFVREGRRARGQMNPGRYWEVTDGKGKFWELSPVGDHKITVTRRSTDDVALVKGEDRDALAYRVANRRQGQSSTPRCEEPGQADIDSARRMIDLVLDEVATLPPNAEYLLRSGLKARNIDVSGADDPVTAALVAISHYQAERAGNPLANVASVEVAARGAGQGEAVAWLMRQTNGVSEYACITPCDQSYIDRGLFTKQPLFASPVGAGGWSKSDLETVARIIDPEIFEQAKDFPKVIGLSRWNRAFAKARAILALPAAPSQGEG